MDSIASLILEHPTVRLAALLLGAWVLYYICKIYLVKIIQVLTRGISSTWKELFLNTRLLSLLSSIVPIVLIYSGSNVIDDLHPRISIGIERICLVLLVVVSIKAINVTLSKFNDIYNTFDTAKNRPIKGLIQVINILVYITAAILIFAAILDKSPWFFLSGFGAMTAVLLLVFRDTILSFVAGIQLTTNSLIRMGDWIEMPQFNADGDVIDIALHTVKVQNWDKTITIIPAHKFLENSFKNWRGMQESGGRRIKRSLYFDMSTIRFLEPEEIEKFSHFALLKDYIERKKEELKKHNETVAPNMIVNSRRMTNIGTFRAYLQNYLKQHPMINQNMSLMVRQMAPGSDGLPLEIYAFVNDVRWVIYEQAQSDIFDHVIAISAEFGLRIHQNPTGFDMREAWSSTHRSV